MPDRVQYYREHGTNAPPCVTTARQESPSLGRARMNKITSVPTSAGKQLVQKSDTVLPLERYYRMAAGSGCAWYYRARSVILPRRRGCKKLHPPLLPQSSGTWHGGHSTTTPEERYYCGLP